MVPSLKFYTGNQLEKLVEELADVIRTPLSSPMTPDIIVVQSRGMARWVGMEIARLNGICMNCKFLFPRAFAEQILKVVFPGMADANLLSGDVLAWRIYSLLPRLAAKKEFDDVRNYLSDNDGLKLFQLSTKIAYLFDQYLVYRPEMLLRWERDLSEKGWQAIIWRELAGKNHPMHLADIDEQLSARMAGAQDLAGLPARVAIFGVSSLPPLYMKLLFELTRCSEVNLFSFSPSREYYAFDLPPKMRAKWRNQEKNRELVARGELESGNPLLSSFGRLSRDFVELRIDLDEKAGFITDDQPESFVEPVGNTMLAGVRGDILHARGLGDPMAGKKSVSVDDFSIQVHACHSPMREVEVLYDQLLDLFNTRPALMPRDIIVMTPDIEKYSPFIHSVFGFPENPACKIPFSVSDRRPQSDIPEVEAFLSLLAMPGSRCTAPEIFSMLERTPIRSCFKFTDENINLIRRWIIKSGIRWGIDVKHRANFGIPDLPGNTWNSGFQRLLLGFAMTGGDRTLFEGIMPYDDIEGEDGEILGRFITAVESLFDTITTLPAERALQEWPETLDAVVRKFFPAATPEEAAGVRIIQNAVEKLRRVAAIAGATEKVDFRAVRHFLAGLLDGAEQEGGFLAGGVTFCALKPMRSIPSAVICLLGMDDQAFPRRQSAPTFDLLARERRCGDQSPRDDDRFSFLEAITSARECLYISYTGRSLVGNETIPPSVVVSELLDCLDQSFLFPENRNAREFVVREHHLQAFSPGYFNGANQKLFSYSGANAAAARNIQMPLHPVKFPFQTPLPEPDEAARKVELRRLIEFFGNPAKYFVRHRLGVQLEHDEDLLEESEPFALNNLEQYQLKQEIVAGELEKHRANWQEFSARGVLPMGQIGEADFLTLGRSTTGFCRKLEQELNAQLPAELIDVDLQVGSFSLIGTIDSIYGNRIVQYRCAKLTAKDWLRCWIKHLAMCAISPRNMSESLLFGEGSNVRFLPAPDAAQIIADLLGIYWRGLSIPIPLFPCSALAYAREKLFPSVKGKLSPMGKARSVWNGSEWTGQGEKNDAYFGFCFPNEDPLDTTFTNLAMEVFAPMLRSGVPSE